MEDPRARAVISELPRFVAGQPLPVIRVTSLPDSVRGIWSLWRSVWRLKAWKFAGSKFGTVVRLAAQRWPTWM